MPGYTWRVLAWEFSPASGECSVALGEWLDTLGEYSPSVSWPLLPDNPHWDVDVSLYSVPLGIQRDVFRT